MNASKLLVAVTALAVVSMVLLGEFVRRSAVQAQIPMTNAVTAEILCRGEISRIADDSDSPDPIVEINVCVRDSLGAGTYKEIARFFDFDEKPAVGMPVEVYNIRFGSPDGHDEIFSLARHAQ